MNELGSPRTRAATWLNGWRRLWIVLSALLLPALIVYALTHSTVFPIEDLLILLAVWAGLVVVIYVLGWSVGWIGRGFRGR